MPRLLLVETDPFMQRTLQQLLAAEGYCCGIPADQEETRRALQGDPFDLVVLGVRQLRSEGLDLLRQIRAGHHMPILLLASRSDVADTVAALEGGADDHLCEPFDPREIVARVRAQLRRADEYSRPVGPHRRIPLGPILLDMDRRDAFRGDTALNLTNREFELLLLLARHPNEALASEWIFQNVWGSAAEVCSKTLAVYIGRLRGKVEANARRPKLLLSIRGFGYKLVNENE